MILQSSIQSDSTTGYASFAHHMRKNTDLSQFISIIGCRTMTRNCRKAYISYKIGRVLQLHKLTRIYDRHHEMVRLLL